MNNQLKYYQGRIPACGVFCGGCPVYVREKKPCPGAEINFQRCENCKTFHLCCKERNITNCFQCQIFPCYKFKRFAKNWLKYGQDLIENQYLLSKIGMDEFLKHYNSKIDCMFFIRQATITDIPEMNELYKNTVLTVNRKDYSAEEVEDWASCGNDIGHWDELLTEQHYIVAENDNVEIVGFASINDTGYMHTLFVHKDFQHQGIATLLYQAIEKYAREKCTEKITSEVSITARPFFEKQGFVVDEEQKREANKLCLTNYKMSKQLNMKFVLRKFRESDLISLVKYANNYNIAKFLTNGFPHPYSEDDGRKFLSMASNNPGIFAIDVDGEAVGSIGIFPQSDIHEKNAEMGYWLAEPFWGNGIIPRAIKEIVEYGFQTFDIIRIFARPFPTNPASQRVLEKAGFVCEARLKNAIYKNGNYMDELIYAIRKDEQKI